MLSVGALIKINEELCPVEKRSEERFQFGQLGYLPFMLDWRMEIVEMFNDNYHGAMLKCKVLNDNLSADVFVRQDDCVEAGPSKIKLDYTILGVTSANDSLIKEMENQVQALFTYRKSLKANGMPISNPELKKNWAEITKLRSKIEKEKQTQSKSITNVLYKKRVYQVDTNEQSEIESKLLRLIRDIRRAEKRVVNTTKHISNTSLTYQVVGGVMASPNQLFLLSEQLGEAILESPKAPKNQENYLGLEIEMILPGDLEEFKKDIIKERLHKTIEITTDGSIKKDLSDTNCLELRVLVKQSELKETLLKLTKLFKRHDCYTNRSCGFHVHLDMRQRDVVKAYSKLFNVQSIMLKTQSKTRVKSKFCKPVTVSKITKKMLNDGDISLADDLSSKRYVTINPNSYKKHKTIEVRLHEGTVKFNDLYYWTMFLVDVVDSNIKKEITDLQELNQVTNPEVIKHLESRIEEYAC